MKRISLLVAMTIAILTFSACSGKTETIDFVGTWNVTEFNYERYYDGDDPSIPHAQQTHAEYGSLGEPRVMTFNSDGTGLDDDSLWGTSVSFTWKYQEGILTIRAAGQQYDNLPFEVNRKGNKVILYYNDFPEDSSGDVDSITVEPGSGYTHPLGTSCQIIMKKSGK